MFNSENKFNNTLMVKQNKSDELHFTAVKMTIFCRTNVNGFIELTEISKL